MRPLSAFFALLLAAWLFAKPSFAATEMEDWAVIAGASQTAFLQDDFAQLEAASSAYRTTKSRTPSGLWKLTLFYVGIDTGISAVARSQEQEAAFRELEGKTTRWAQQYPDSPSAYIAQSMVHLAHAWAYRGNGVASTVKPNAWAPFRKYTALARQNLEAHKAVAAVDPRWYEAMLTVAMTESWKRDAFDRLLNEALAKEPAFYQTYFLALDYLLPKWHGGLQEIEAFAHDAVRRTSKQEGQGMYARIYWYASQSQFSEGLFTESFAAWPRMKEGFEDVVARYPDAWNLNNYAKFACLAQDKPKTRELLQRTRLVMIPEAWSHPYLRQQCSDWALREGRPHTTGSRLIPQKK